MYMPIRESYRFRASAIFFSYTINNDDDDDNNNKNNNKYLLYPEKFHKSSIKCCYSQFRLRFVRGLHKFLSKKWKMKKKDVTSLEKI